MCNHLAKYAGNYCPECASERLEEIADRLEAGELLSDKTMSDRAFLAPLLEAPELEPVPGAEPRYDDDGREIVQVATCGTCGRSWNDAAVSSVTPVPAGRCPFEYDHDDERCSCGGTFYFDRDTSATTCDRCGADIDD